MSDSPADRAFEIRQLRERVRVLEATLRHSKNLLFSVDEEGRITGVNDTVEQVLGFSEQELTGTPFDDLIAPASLQSVTELHAAMRTRSGKTVDIELHRERRIVVGLDRAERQALEEGARQSQRMETLGLLAGGIAHDFNNLLTGILGHAYMLQNDKTMTQQHGEALEVIVKSSERAAQLTTQLLGFARGKKPRHTSVDLHQIIRDVTELLRRTIDKKVRITAATSASEFHAVGDGCQMHQVLLNLCLNARDAMPDGGELRITTRNAGRTIVITVADTGVGITPEVRPHIFEAFYTTKGSDRGTGMGLATVQAIVRNHGGAIDMQSEPGAGTAFHITLPVSRSSTKRPARVQHVQRHGTGKVLVIEDEPFVRRVLERMLSDFGYTVVCANDVRSGVEYFRKHCSTIDVVILDLVMPSMNGLECLEILRSIDADVRAVLTSGSGHGGIPGVEYLAKPYQPDQLAEVVRRAMHKAPPLSFVTGS